MGALDTRRGKGFGFLAEKAGGEVFVELLDLVAARYPTGKGHIVCDNQSSHDTDDVLDWLVDHPRWTIHFTPKHASWCPCPDGPAAAPPRSSRCHGSKEPKR
jgi:hypothetical protein